MSRSPESHLQAVARAEQSVQAARERVEQAVDRRADALTAAHDAGLTWRKLAETMGVRTAQQVQQAADVRRIRASRRKPTLNAGPA